MSDDYFALGTRLRVLASPEIHKFLHGAEGVIIPSPEKHALRDRQVLKLHPEVPHPYGGVIRTMWVDKTMVEVISG